MKKNQKSFLQNFKMKFANSYHGGGHSKLRNAFTLIELLAIIVILAIIAVITVPIILNVIENAKRGSITDSAYGYKDAVQKYYVQQLSINPNFNLNNSYIIVDGRLEGIEIPINGTKPVDGVLTYENNILKDGCLVFDEYQVIFENGKVIETSKGQCEQILPTSCFIEDENYYSNTNLFTFDDANNNPGTITGFSDIYNNLEDSDPKKKNIVIPCTRTVGTEEIPITEIKGDGAFKNAQIENVIITDNITNIENGTFCDANINKVIFGKSMELIGIGSFNVSTIDELIFIDGPKTINIAFSNTNIRKITFGKSIEFITSAAFNGSKIDELIFIDGPKTIDGTSFSNSSINKVTFGGTIELINNLAFSNSIIDELTFIEGPYKIESDAFVDSNINKIVFGNNIKILTTRAFRGSKFNILEFGTGLETIEFDSFKDTQIKKIELPNGLKRFGYGAFRGQSLEEIVFPTSMEDIDLTYVSGYPNLKTIHYNGTKTFDWGEILGGTATTDDATGTITVTRTDNSIVTILKD